MNRSFKEIFFELLIIILVGLTPLLWFQGNEIILGHDSGLVISPISHFFDRLYLWTYRFGLGQDQTYALSGFMIHGLEALIFGMSKQLQVAQKIIFVFWFLLPGLTMYFFGKYLEQKFKLSYIALISAVFFMFNHFLLQGWFIAERTKFSLYAALPLFLLLMLRWFDKKNTTLVTGLLTAILFFFLNGNASFPLFGAIIIVFFVYLIIFLYPIYRQGRLFQFIALLVISGFSSALLNLYWLLPFYNFVKSSYVQAVAQVGGVSGVLTWVNYISRDSSILNLLRLQGIPEWYQNPDHAYANNFFTNPILVLLGFLIPIIVFLLLFIIDKFKEKMLLLYFLLLSVVAIVFVGGSHPPFGVFYIFMVKFVPGFIAFRTPFYKFAPALWFAYSVLIGISISYFLQEFVKKGWAKIFVVLLVVCTIIMYSYPFLNGSFFNYIKDKRTMKTYVPDYVYEFRDWIDTQNLSGKILALPFSNRSFKVDVYTWNYWSLSPISSLLTSVPIVNRNGMSEDELQVFDQLDLLMRNSDSGWKSLAKLLKIKYLLVRQDFIANSEGSATFPLASYKAAITDSDVKLYRKFGAWELHEITDNSRQSASRLIGLEGSSSKIGIIATIPGFDPNDVVYSNVVGENLSKMTSLTSKEYIVPQCIFCNLEYAPLNKDLYRPLITNGSIFYSISEQRGKRKVAGLIGVDKAKHYLYKSLELLLAFDKVVIEDKDLTSIPLILDGYDSGLNSFKFELINILKKSENSNDLLLEIENVLRVEEETINDNAGKLTDKVLLERLAKSFSAMREIKKIVMNNLWRTENETHKRFLVNIPGDSDYTIYVRSNYQENAFDSMQYRINDLLGEKKQIEKNGWIDLGLHNLKKGLHRVEIIIPTTNIYHGEDKEISSSSNGSCFSSQTFMAKPGEEYKISFNHKRLKGNKKFYFKINSSGQKPNLLDKTDSVINSQGQWDTYETVYKATNIPQDKFYFSVCDAPDLTEKFSSAIKISDINVRRIITPDVVLERSIRDKRLSIIIPKKIDPTKYSFNAVKDSIVVLPTSNNVNWQINNSNIKFVANGYANGWLMEEDSNGIIEYRTQKYVISGFIMSGITLVGIIIYFSYVVIKKKF